MTYFCIILLGLLTLSWVRCYFVTKQRDDPDLFFWLAIAHAVWVGFCFGALFILSLRAALPSIE